MLISMVPRPDNRERRIRRKVHRAIHQSRVHGAWTAPGTTAREFAGAKRTRGPTQFFAINAAVIGGRADGA